MFYRDTPLKVKSLSETGEFTGYGAIYETRDSQDDIVQRGAFDQSIAKQGDGFPLLWAHKQDVPIGLARIEDSAAALIVHGSIDLADPDGAVAYRRLKKGIVRGLSIGFSLPRGEGKISFDSGVRRLREIRLHEISLVAIPAQPGALITTVKSVSEARRLIGELEGGELEDDVLAELQQIQTFLKTMLKQPEPQPDAGLLAALSDLATTLRPN